MVEKCSSHRISKRSKLTHRSAARHVVRRFKGSGKWRRRLWSLHHLTSDDETIQQDQRRAMRSGTTILSENILTDTAVSSMLSVTHCSGARQTEIVGVDYFKVRCRNDDI